MSAVYLATAGSYPNMSITRAPQPPSNMAEAATTRGERLISRYDANKDGALDLGEMEGTRLGKRMTVDRFTRLDVDGDGALNAEELSEGRKGRGFAFGYRSDAIESAVLSALADNLAEQVPEVPEGESLAAMMMDRLDADGSGALNSEEIAGTRLAERIGGDFYDLDVDKSGTLDTAELGTFLGEEVLGLAEAVAEGDEVDQGESDEVAAPASLVGDDVSGVQDAEDMTSVIGIEADDEGDLTAPDAAEILPDTAAETNLTAFETALKLLQDSQENRQTFNVLSAFYNDVKTIFGG